MRVLLWALPIPIVMAAVSYVGDPGELFYRQSLRSRITQIVLDGGNALVATIPSNWGGLQVDFVHGFDARGRTPDTTVWGTSRSSDLIAADFPEGTFFNHALPGGSILDYAAVYELYREHGRFPRSVVISIDPWTFISRNGVDVDGKRLWLPSPDRPLAAGAGLGTLARHGVASLGLDPSIVAPTEAEDPLQRLQVLLSPSYFQSALLPMKQLVPVATPLRATLGGLVLRADGSYTLCPDPSVIRPAAVAQAADRFARAIKGHLLDELVVVPRYVEVLDRMIGALRKDGVKVTLFLSPIHADAYDRLTKDRPNAIEVTLVALAKKHGARLFGSFDPHRYALEAKDPWFFDEYHLTRGGLERVLRAGPRSVDSSAAMPIGPVR